MLFFSWFLVVFLLFFVCSWSVLVCFVSFCRSVFLFGGGVFFCFCFILVFVVVFFCLGGRGLFCFFVLFVLVSFCML